MKKSIVIAITSFALLLAGESISTSVANASTDAPETYNIYPRNNLGDPVFVRAQRVQTSVKLRVKQDIMSSTAFDGSDSTLGNIYGAGTNLEGTLYYNPVFNKFAYLINDPSTSNPSWVSTDLVETV
jgi:hypothetical protein